MRWDTAILREVQYAYKEQRLLPPSSDLPQSSMTSLDDTTSDLKFGDTAETGAASKQSILSLDDGGVRGYVALLVLRRLMVEIDHWERETEEGDVGATTDPTPAKRPSTDSATTPSPINHPLSRVSTVASPQQMEPILQTSSALARPCDYFDFIVGSGTGGLIAIMLGRLRMSLHECFVEFFRLTVQILRQSQQLLDKRFFSKRQQHTDLLHHRIQQLFEEQGAKLQEAHPSQMTLKSANNVCNIVVVAHDATKEQHTIFRSYDHTETSKNSRVGPRSPGPASDTPLWLVARATTSRPNYFAPTTIGDARYKDGGFSCRNPSQEIIHEVLDLGDADRHSIDCLVSIGCGTPKAEDADGDNDDNVPKGKRFKPPSRNAQERMAACDCDVTHEMATNVMFTLQKAYFRLDMQSDLWDLSLETFVSDDGNSDFARNPILDEEVHTMLEGPAIQQKLRNCALRLVERRRARARLRSARNGVHAA